jgi:copper(I)-binding protein
MKPILFAGAFAAAIVGVAASSSVMAQTPSGAAPAETYKAGPLVIAKPWSRATPGGAKVAGGYVTITNTGTAPDRLTAVTLSGAGPGEVHESTNSGGVVRMRPVEGGLEIKPGATVELKPGGYHVMFLGLKQPLKNGERLSGTLTFEKAGTVPVEFAVRSLGAQNAGASEHRH